MPEKGEHEYKWESLLKRLRALFCKGRLHAVRLILINVVNIYVQISIDFAWNKIGGGNVRNPIGQEGNQSSLHKQSTTGLFTNLM